MRSENRSSTILVYRSSMYCLHMYHRERILETSTLSCNEEEEEITKPPKRWGRAPRLFWELSEWGHAHPFYRGAPPLFWVLTQNQQAPIHFPILSPLLPSTSADHPPPPPYLGQGGTTHPSTPFDLKSSVATSWPQDGFLTTSQAITMNPRSQWSLFEFGKWLNCERICIQKFSCCSGERGHFVLVCLMGRL